MRTNVTEFSSRKPTVEEANLQGIFWPACCLSCDNVNKSATFCNKLDIELEDPMQICKFYEGA